MNRVQNNKMSHFVLCLCHGQKQQSRSAASWCEERKKEQRLKALDQEVLQGPVAGPLEPHGSCWDYETTRVLDGFDVETLIAYSHKKWQTLDSEFFDKCDPLISSQLFFLAWSLHFFPVECFLVRSSHHLYMQFCPGKSHFTPYFLVFYIVVDEIPQI